MERDQSNCLELLKFLQTKIGMTEMHYDLDENYIDVVNTIINPLD